MKARHTLLTILALAISLPLPAESPAPKSWKVLKSGTDGVLASVEGESGSRRAPWIELAADKKDVDALWKKYVPGAPGSVDFGSETVIFLLLGAQQTGGYAIEPIAADPAVDGVVRVHAKLVQPMGDEETTEALTAPYAVMAVRARGITKVEWIDADGRLLATRFAE